jgi:hypothetical protein
VAIATAQASAADATTTEPQTDDTAEDLRELVTCDAPDHE